MRNKRRNSDLFKVAVGNCALFAQGNLVSRLLHRLIFRLRRFFSSVYF